VHTTGTEAEEGDIDAGGHGAQAETCELSPEGGGNSPAPSAEEEERLVSDDEHDDAQFRTKEQVKSAPVNRLSAF
jgi:hypothetical protein